MSAGPDPTVRLPGFSRVRWQSSRPTAMVALDCKAGQADRET